MELTLSLLNTFVVVAVGLALTYIVTQRTSDLRAEIRREMEELRTEFRREMEALRAEVGSLRSDLTQVALAVGAGGTAAER